MGPYYIHDGADVLTLQIIGPLTGSATAELEQAWQTARSTLAGRSLVVELGDHTYVDSGGLALLRRLSRHGARWPLSFRRDTDLSPLWTSIPSTA